MSGSSERRRSRMSWLLDHGWSRRPVESARVLGRSARFRLAVVSALVISVFSANAAFAAHSGAGQLSQSISRAESNQQLLVGDWLGPGDGATNCGAQYDEVWLYKDLSFTWT